MGRNEPSLLVREGGKGKSAEQMRIREQEVMLSLVRVGNSLLPV